MVVSELTRSIVLNPTTNTCSGYLNARTRSLSRGAHAAGAPGRPVAVSSKDVLHVTVEQKATVRASPRACQRCMVACTARAS